MAPERSSAIRNSPRQVLQSSNVPLTPPVSTGPCECTVRTCSSFSRPPSAAAHRSSTCSLVSAEFCAEMDSPATKTAAQHVLRGICNEVYHVLESGMADQPITRSQAGQILGAAAATPLLAAEAPDICFLTAVEMAALIRRKKLSAREVMDVHLKQIDRVNPKVNAIVTLVADQARENARKADDAQARGATLGPLHGLPRSEEHTSELQSLRHL